MVLIHILVLHYQVELGRRLAYFDRRSQKRWLALQLVPRVHILMKLVPRHNYVALIYARHFHAFLLLEIAEVLEALAVIIHVHLQADRMQRVRIGLVHLAGGYVYKSRAPFRHEDGVSPSALIALNSRSTFLETFHVLSIHCFLM